MTVAVVAPVVVAVLPPGLALTVYRVIEDPPLLTGAVQDTIALVPPRVATTPLGADGVVLGMTAVEAAEAGEVPIAFVAVTVNL